MWIFGCTYTYALEQYSASFLSAAPAKNLSCEIYAKLSVHKRKSSANRESHAFRKPEKLNITRVPTRTGKTGKPGKMGRHFPVREKSGNFEQTGKVREKSGKTTQNTGKLREFQKKIICSLSMIFK